MSTADEMRAITATFSAQGVQETLPLVAAGYREVPMHLPKYKPIIGWEAAEQRRVLSEMTNHYGHCGQ